MDQCQNFCLQSLKEAIDDCNNKDVDVDDGKKKTSEEVNRLKKTSITAEKSHFNKEEKVQEAKIQKKKKTVKFSSTTTKASNFRGIQSQTRILNSKVRYAKIYYKPVLYIHIIFSFRYLNLREIEEKVAEKLSVFPKNL